MSIAQSFLAEFEQESRTTWKFLERVPEGQFEWRPHPKSMTAGQLALHIARSPAGVVKMAEQDVAAPPNFGAGQPQPKSLKEVMDAFGEALTVVRSTLPKFTDDQMRATWTLRVEGRDLLSIPRMAFLRSILLNHIYHHRGQLGVYLRLLGANVPSSYGPSGDEAPDFGASPEKK